MNMSEKEQQLQNCLDKVIQQETKIKQAEEKKKSQQELARKKVIEREEKQRQMKLKKAEAERIKQEKRVESERLKQEKQEKKAELERIKQEKKAQKEEAAAAAGVTSSSNDALSPKSGGKKEASEASQSTPDEKLNKKQQAMFKCFFVSKKKEGDDDDDVEMKSSVAVSKSPSNEDTASLQFSSQSPRNRVWKSFKKSGDAQYAPTFRASEITEQYTIEQLVNSHPSIDELKKRVMSHWKKAKKIPTPCALPRLGERKAAVGLSNLIAKMDVEDSGEVDFFAAAALQASNAATCEAETFLCWSLRQFEEDYRPAWFGVEKRRSSTIKGRLKSFLKQDPWIGLDYEADDSGVEWFEEESEGEDIDDDGDEGDMEEEDGDGGGGGGTDRTDGWVEDGWVVAQDDAEFGDADIIAQMERRKLLRKQQKSEYPFHSRRRKGDSIDAPITLQIPMINQLKNSPDPRFQKYLQLISTKASYLHISDLVEHNEADNEIKMEEEAAPPKSASTSSAATVAAASDKAKDKDGEKEKKKKKKRKDKKKDKKKKEKDSSGDSSDKGSKNTQKKKKRKKKSKKKKSKKDKKSKPNQDDVEMSDATTVTVTDTVITADTATTGVATDVTTDVTTDVSTTIAITTDATTAAAAEPPKDGPISDAVISETVPETEAESSEEEDDVEDDEDESSDEDDATKDDNSVDKNQKSIISFFSKPNPQPTAVTTAPTKPVTVSAKSRKRKLSETKDIHIDLTGDETPEADAPTEPLRKKRRIAPQILQSESMNTTTQISVPQTIPVMAIAPSNVVPVYVTNVPSTQPTHSHTAVNMGINSVPFSSPPAVLPSLHHNHSSSMVIDLVSPPSEKATEKDAKSMNDNVSRQLSTELGIESSNKEIAVETNGNANDEDNDSPMTDA